MGGYDQLCCPASPKLLLGLDLGLGCDNRDVHETAFLMVHNKLPLQERLFRIQLASDPYCQVCSSAPIQDVSHFFVSCERVQHYWVWVKSRCIEALGFSDIDDDALLNFYWPTSRKDRDVSWLIGHYVYIVWDMLFSRKQWKISDGEFYGYLKFKYKEAVLSSAVSGLKNWL